LSFFDSTINNTFIYPSSTIINDYVDQRYRDLAARDDSSDIAHQLTIDLARRAGIGWSTQVAMRK
jgi:hypothetical protein